MVLLTRHWLIFPHAPGYWIGYTPAAHGSGTFNQELVSESKEVPEVPFFFEAAHACLFSP